MSLGLAGANLVVLASAVLLTRSLNSPPFWGVVGYVATWLLVVVAPLALVGLIVAAAIDAFAEPKQWSGPCNRTGPTIRSRW